MAAKADGNEKGKEKVMVARKRLQSVPDLLTNGDEDATATESTTSKLLWMAFLLLLFYLSFELLIRLGAFGDKDEGGSGGSKAEL